MSLKAASSKKHSSNVSGLRSRVSPKETLPAMRIDDVDEGNDYNELGQKVDKAQSSRGNQSSFSKRKQSARNRNTSLTVNELDDSDMPMDDDDESVAIPAQEQEDEDEQP